jgi:hypothetical protein
VCVCVFIVFALASVFCFFPAEAAEAVFLLLSRCCYCDRALFLCSTVPVAVNNFE